MRLWTKDYLCHVLLWNLHAVLFLSRIEMLSEANETQSYPSPFFRTRIDTFVLRDVTLVHKLLIPEHFGETDINYLYSNKRLGEGVVMATSYAILLKNSSHNQQYAVIAGSLFQRGFENGYRTEARFDGISGLTSAPSRSIKLLIADRLNYCVRSFSLATYIVRTYAGKCKFKGNVQSSFKLSRFGRIISIASHPTLTHKTYLFDADSLSIKVLDDTLKWVRNVYQSFPNNSAAYVLAVSPYDNRLYLANEELMWKLHSSGNSDRVPIIDGIGYKDGYLNVSKFALPYSFSFLSKSVFLFTDFGNSLLRVVDTKSGLVSSVCRKGSRDFKPGNISECCITYPKAMLHRKETSEILIVSKNSIYSLGYTVVKEGKTRNKTEDSKVTITATEKSTLLNVLLETEWLLPFGVVSGAFLLFIICSFAVMMTQTIKKRKFSGAATGITSFQRKHALKVAKTRRSTEKRKSGRFSLPKEQKNSKQKKTGSTTVNILKDSEQKHDEERLPPAIQMMKETNPSEYENEYRPTVPPKSDRLLLEIRANHQAESVEGASYYYECGVAAPEEVFGIELETMYFTNRPKKLESSHLTKFASEKDDDQTIYVPTNRRRKRKTRRNKIDVAPT